MRTMTMEPANATPGDGFDLEMAVSTLQSNSTDVRIMLKVLAGQLAEVLGDRMQVERAGGRFRKSDEIKSVQIVLGDDTLRAEVEGATVRCSIGHASGGIRIRSEQVEHGRLADPPAQHPAERGVPQRAHGWRSRTS